MLHPQDALFISSLLTSTSVVDAPLPSRPTKVQQAIKAFIAARHSRSNRVLTTSNEAGELYEFNDPEAGDDLAKIKEKLDVRQKWIWEWDTEGFVCVLCLLSRLVHDSKEKANMAVPLVDSVDSELKKALDSLVN
jgi:hypothetical protein